MRVDIYINRTVSEVATIEVASLEELQMLVESNELFEEIDNQGVTFEETGGDILDIGIEIDNGKITEYKITDDNKLVKIDIGANGNET